RSDASGSPRAPTGAERMLERGRLTTVIVQREPLIAARQRGEGHRLVSALVCYVNDIQRKGVYARHEMLAKLMQAYHAHYYLAQVNNGGHSQFIRNAGAQLEPACADALAGLKSMGARGQRRTLKKMMAWMKANPAEAQAQDGFSRRAPFLGQLDEQFYTAE